MKTLQEFTKVSSYLALLVSFVLATSLDSLSPTQWPGAQPAAPGFHSSSLAIPPQKKCFSPKSSRKSPQDGSHLPSLGHIFIPGQIPWPGECNILIGWALPQSLEEMSVPALWTNSEDREAFPEEKRMDAGQAKTLAILSLGNRKALSLPLGT